MPVVTVDSKDVCRGVTATSESVLVGAAVVILLGLHSALLAWEAYIHSPTVDEPGHLAAGLSIWQHGRFDVYSVNPPLVHTIAAIPVTLMDIKTDWGNLYEAPGARPEIRLGYDFVAANGERSMWLFSLARWACIPLSLLGGYVCFLWGRAMYGSIAGILSLALWCLCPNILGHGQLITSDVAATSFAVATGYTFWCWLRLPTWWHTLKAGMALGAAELAKTTLVVFYPIMLAMWLLYRPPKRVLTNTGQWLREAVMFLVVILVSTYILNAGFGFAGTCTPLGSYRFVSKALSGTCENQRAGQLGGNRFRNTWLENVPVPLPKHYLLGIDLQRRDFETDSQCSYLRGEFSPNGWWYYYLYGLAIKVPIGTWVLLGLAATRRFWLEASFARGRQGACTLDELILITPLMTILLFVSSQTGFSHHLRYALPVLPFAYVWIGRATMLLGNRRQAVAIVLIGALTWSIASSLWVYPHCLSYFNELVGGPSGGPAHLIHSNVDWGQDLLLLKRWMKQHPEAKPFNLIYFGYFDPRHIGLEYTISAPLLSARQRRVARTQIPPGWYAVSVNIVRGYAATVSKGDGSVRYLNQKKLVVFQQLKPVAMAGYSIYVYHVD